MTAFINVYKYKKNNFLFQNRSCIKNLYVYHPSCAKLRLKYFIIFKFMKKKNNLNIESLLAGTFNIIFLFLV